MTTHAPSWLAFVISYSFTGPINFYWRRFIVLGIPGRAYRRLMVWILSFASYKPLGLQPLLTMRRGTCPSWVTKAKRPRRGQCDGNANERKVISMVGNGTMTPQGTPSYTPSPKFGHLPEIDDTHQGETGSKA
jgi:hypothetical protein